MLRNAIAALVLLVTPIGASANTITDLYSSLFIFGDSLASDNKSGPLAPPSFDGRFTNGLTYADVLANDFDAAGLNNFNFALGGATAGNVNTTPYPVPALAAPFATFQSQVSTFDFLNFDQAAGSNPLFSVIFGANDIFQNLLSPTIGTDAALAVEAGIRAVGALGGNFRNFVVANVPDLSLIPRFAGTAAAGIAQARAVDFNRQLALSIDSLRFDGYTIFEADLDGFLKDARANPSALGLSNVTDACTPTLTTVVFAGNCSFTGTGFDITLADSFLFVDQVHPNRVAHAAFAEEIRNAVAPVPLPAGLPLMLAGLGIFALGAARQRRATA